MSKNKKKKLKKKAKKQQQLMDLQMQQISEVENEKVGGGLTPGHRCAVVCSVSTWSVATPSSCEMLVLVTITLGDTGKELYFVHNGFFIQY